MRAATILLASSFVLFAMAGMAPALPAIEHAFADLPEAGLLTRMVLTTTALAIAASAPFAGFVIDRFGRKPVLLAALLAYAALATAPLWLDALPTILATRAALGVAVGMLLTTLTTLVGDFYQGAARNRMAGAQSAVMVLAVALGSMAAGFLAESGWRQPFWMYAGVLAVIPLVVVAIREPAAPARRARSPFPSAPGARFPVLPVALVYLLMWTAMVTTFLVPSQAPFLLREIGVPGASLAGIAIAVFNIPAGMTAFAFRRLRARLSNAAILAGCFALLGIGYLLAAGAGGAVQVLIGMAVAGIGFGPLMPTINAWLLAIAPLEVRGRLVGGLTFCQFTGFVCSPFFSQPLAEATGVAGVYAMTGALQIAAAVVFLLAALAARRRRVAG